MSDEESLDESIEKEAPAEDKKKKAKKPKKKSLKDQVKELEELLAESKDQTLRVRAEYDNYRKRIGKDLTDTRNAGKLSAVSEMLTVVDYFQMAKVHAETSDDVESIKQGIMMILNEFTRCFDNLGIETIEAKANDVFDPNVHDAMSTEASDEVEAHHVIAQVKVGYKMGDRVIRAASVVVSSGTESPDVSAESADEAEQEETV